MAPLEALAADAAFWNQTLDGLAVLAGRGVFEVFQLPRSVPERVIVADSFHVKPLLRYLQLADRFQVLALTRERAMVFAGNRYALDPVHLTDDFPARLEQVVVPEKSQPGVAVASSSAGVGSPKMLRGYGRDKVDIDTEKFFRAVDRAMAEQLSKPSGMPLVLAALPEHRALFHRVSHNPLLLASGADADPTAMPVDALREQAWQALAPQYAARMQRRADDYRSASARQAGSADLVDVARAAVAGRVETLLVEAERRIEGLIDRRSGSVLTGPAINPHHDDVLDDLAELVLAKGGAVVVVTAPEMPTTTGLAAVYRF